MDNKELFSLKSEDYSRFRPSYPECAARWLKQNCSGERVADIGAGTGFFTKVLIPYFKDVCAVEPNAAMRKKFSCFLPQIPCSGGSGEDTKLADSSIDLITVAQAFHWLDEEKFKREAMRILTLQGKVAIVWNTSLKNDFTISRDEVCKKYCPRFSSGYAGKRTPAEGDHFLRHVYFKEVEFISFANPHKMTKEEFIGNMRSRSYALTADAPSYSDFIDELNKVFAEHAANGIVTEPIETQIYLGKF